MAQALPTQPTIQTNINTDTDQYSLGKILGIWTAITIPMPILGFLIAPQLFPVFPEMEPGFIFTICIVIGLAWQFVVTMLILRRELTPFNWETIRQRLWIQHPRNPKTGEKDYKKWWMLIPAMAVAIAISMGVVFWANNIGTVIPFMRPLPFADTTQLITPEFLPQIVGQWWIFILLMVWSLFNFFLGEEFLFRGLMLPKMKGVFGQWDWVANGALFGLYHFHIFWNIPAIIVLGFALSSFTYRYKSIWFSVIMHGFMPMLQNLLLIFVIAGLVTP